MAHNLYTKGALKELYVYDVSKETTAKFVKEHPNAKVCSSPKELATKCKTIISMVQPADSGSCRRACKAGLSWRNRCRSRTSSRIFAD
jgi:3-hydroxyisobutyrate dehydrogenase-like beta-hydroxyacid dehydrogenase